MSGVSASVESGLVQQLQTEIAALRDENRDIGHDLHETELECTAHLKEVAMLRDENERLRQELAELKAQPPPNPKTMPRTTSLISRTTGHTTTTTRTEGGLKTASSR